MYLQTNESEPRPRQCGKDADIYPLDRDRECVLYTSRIRGQLKYIYYLNHKLYRHGILHNKWSVLSSHCRAKVLSHVEAHRGLFDLAASQHLELHSAERKLYHIMFIL